MAITVGSASTLTSPSVFCASSLIDRPLAALIADTAALPPLRKSASSA